MFLLSAVSDWFTDKSNPWYYVCGAAVLVVFITALTVYIVLSSKRKKKKQKERAEASNGEIEKSEAVNAEADGEKEAETEEGADTQKSTTEKNSQAENESAETENKVTEEGSADEQSEKADEQKVEAAVAEQKVESEEKKPAKKKTKKEPVIEIATKKPKTESAAKPKTAVKSSRSQKPFIDRLIADKANQSIYNALKNTILSYTLIKAKLTADEELFLNDKEKKAALRLEVGKLILYLALDPDTAPQMFNLQKSNNDELKSMLVVTSSNIDTAEKAITFAMNVSMMVRSSSHHTVDYVKRAIDAKERAKNKAKK